MPLNLTATHRITGRGSITGVRRVLQRLVGTGIVSDVPGGYILNREHIASPAIEALAQLWRELFERVQLTVSEWPEPPRLVGVFGSAARRDGDEDSDIDLLILSDAADASERGAALAEQVQRWTGNVTHVVTVTPAELRRLKQAREPLLDEWSRDVVAIVGSRDALKATSR